MSNDIVSKLKVERSHPDGYFIWREAYGERGEFIKSYLFMVALPAGGPYLYRLLDEGMKGRNERHVAMILPDQVVWADDLPEEIVIQEERVPA